MEKPIMQIEWLWMKQYKCKKVAKAVEDKNLTEAKELLKAAVALIDHSVSTGLQHQNTANRQKAHLMKLVYSLEVSAKAAE